MRAGSTNYRSGHGLSARTVQNYKAQLLTFIGTKKMVAQGELRLARMGAHSMVIDAAAKRVQSFNRMVEALKGGPDNA